MEQTGSLNKNNMELAIRPDLIKTTMERLKALGGYWISRDVKMENSLTIPARSIARDEVTISLTKEDLPPVPLSRELFTLLNWSTRSYLAQIGIEVDFDADCVTDEMLLGLNEGRQVSIPVDILNLSNRPIEVSGGIMRFFWVNEDQRLRGEGLAGAVNSQQIMIKGVAGADWMINEGGTAITLPIRQVFAIPTSEEVVRISGKKDLPGVQMPVSQVEETEFKIGETPPIRMGKETVGVINWGVQDLGGRHTRSPLIDPGFEGPIRTETVNTQGPISLLLYRK
ncbi:hypothetical protein KBD34_02005 [Patescibacteria group bacterium]|nr:hypothetical protein [Patescibacteria group bacterium]